MKKIRSDYKICEYCGASLDPGEKCDCKKAKTKAPIIWHIEFNG